MFLGPILVVHDVLHTSQAQEHTWAKVQEGRRPFSECPIATLVVVERKHLLNLDIRRHWRHASRKKSGETREEGSKAENPSGLDQKQGDGSILIFHRTRTSGLSWISNIFRRCTTYVHNIHPCMYAGTALLCMKKRDQRSHRTADKVGWWGDVVLCAIACRLVSAQAEPLAGHDTGVVQVWSRYGPGVVWHRSVDVIWLRRAAVRFQGRRHKWQGLKVPSSSPPHN